MWSCGQVVEIRKNENLRVQSSWIAGRLKRPRRSSSLCGLTWDKRGFGIEIGNSGTRQL